MAESEIFTLAPLDTSCSSSVRDLRGPETREEFAWSEPEAYLRRREFLQRTAMLAGLGVSAATVLSSDTLVSAAAAKQTKGGLPGRRNLPIDTFVVLMMENRSFDHYLGWLPGADGRQAGLKYKDRTGKSVSTHRLTNDFQGCAFADPDHSWTGGRRQYARGKLDGFLRSGDSDTFAIGYYAEKDIPFIPSIAKQFTTFDRFFCSLLAPTYPNREYMHAAQSYGEKANTVPEGGFPDTTIFAALDRAGVSNRYFYTDVPVSALWGQAGLARSAKVDEFYDRASAGTLPSVSFVDPAFAGEEQGTSGDEHPHGDIRTGQAFMSDVVHAFLESPQWKRGLLMVIYDEWGGFFDTVTPPVVPDGRASRNLFSNFGQMGFRIPAVAISPYAHRKHVDHQQWGFESILKLIEYRYGLPPLTRRDKHAANIGLALDFDAKPNYEAPDLPTAPAVMSAACAAPPPDSGSAVLRPKPHDLAQLVNDGYLERLGYQYRPASPAMMFRQPSSMGL